MNLCLYGLYLLIFTTLDMKPEYFLNIRIYKYIYFPLSIRAMISSHIIVAFTKLYNNERMWREKANNISVCLQFSSVAQSCPTLCDSMNRSTPGLPAHHQHPEFTHTHVHQVHDAIQPSHTGSSPSPPAPKLSQHQSLFQ